MTHYLKIFLSILLLSILCACSFSKKQNSVTETSISKEDIMQQVQPKTSCKYTFRKGVAELMLVQKHHFRFVFFPGNVEFSIKKNELIISPQKGDEFKALYEELVQGNDDCTKPIPQLIGLPH